MWIRYTNVDKVHKMERKQILLWFVKINKWISRKLHFWVMKINNR